MVYRHALRRTPIHIKSIKFFRIYSILFKKPTNLNLVVERLQHVSTKGSLQCGGDQFPFNRFTWDWTQLTHAQNQWGGGRASYSSGPQHTPIIVLLICGLLRLWGRLQAGPQIVGCSCRHDRLRWTLILGNGNLSLQKAPPYPAVPGNVCWQLNLSSTINSALTGSWATEIYEPRGTCVTKAAQKRRQYIVRGWLSNNMLGILQWSPDLEITSLTHQ